jgi:hypothetical protein
MDFDSAGSYWPIYDCHYGQWRKSCGFEGIANHLGQGLWAWTKDMQAHSVSSEELVIQEIIPVILDRLGSVDTLGLEKERGEFLDEIIRLGKEKKTLM